MFNYNHLYYFCVAAKSTGVKEAAQHLKISQPSLSSQLKVLEKSIDARLFYRVGRNNKLTAVGTIVFGFCRQMFELSEEMSELLAQKIPSAARRLHIGVSDEVDRPFVVEVVSVFMKKHGLGQRPKVSIVSGTHEQLAERLRFREVDVIVTPIAMIEPELRNLECAEVPVGLICPKTWEMAEKNGTLYSTSSIKKFLLARDVHWLMPSSRFKLRSEIDQFFEVNGIKGRVVLESDVIASLVRSVIDEIGIAFLPLIYLTREMREKTVRIICPKEGYWKYRVWLACHTQSQNDPLIQGVAKSFKEISLMSKR